MCVPCKRRWRASVGSLCVLVGGMLVCVCVVVSLLWVVDC